MNFTYEATAKGYRVFYKGKPLGGVGIMGEYQGRKASEQQLSYAKQAARAISELERGHGPKHMLETLAKYKAEEFKP